jgi:predicted RNA-binding protein YlqC (UPF0109 family)
MKEFIEYLIKQIVAQQEQVNIVETDEEGLKVFKIHVATDDMGTVIGKEGHTIKSIRDLVRAKAIKDDVRVRVVVEESQIQNDQV